MQQRNFIGAHNIYNKITSHHSIYARARLNELFCWWLEGSQRHAALIYDEIKNINVSKDMITIAALLTNNLGKRQAIKVLVDEEGITLLFDFLQRIFALGEWERGLSLLDGVEIRPFCYLNLEMAKLCFKYGNLELCEEYLNAHISKDARCAAAYYYLAQIKEEQGLLVDAECCLRQAVRLDKKNPQYSIYLVQLYNKLEQYTREEVMELYPGIPFLSFD